MKNFILFLTAFFAINLVALAQPKDGPKQDKEEYIRTQKIAFISTELALTPEEAEKFWPIYNEYEAKMEENRKERKGYHKQLKTINDLSEDQAYELIEKILACDSKEAAIRKEYLAKFAEVLGKKKAAKVFYAEEKFKRELLKEIHHHDKPYDGPNPHD
jgi:Spy/CpxP family protein refolding chaperone